MPNPLLGSANLGTKKCCPVTKKDVLSALNAPVSGAPAVPVFNPDGTVTFNTELPDYTPPPPAGSSVVIQTLTADGNANAGTTFLLLDVTLGNVVATLPNPSTAGRIEMSVLDLTTSGNFGTVTYAGGFNGDPGTTTTGSGVNTIASAAIAGGPMVLIPDADNDQWYALNL